MKPTLKVGLIGAGVFAGYHAGKISAHARSTLVGVHDESAERASLLAQTHGTDVHTELQTLIDASDAIVVATPASRHFDFAKPCLEQGRHMLIEKPLCPEPGHAETLVRLAEAQGTVLQVGHQERVVAGAIGLLGIPDRPKEINIRRHMPRTARNLDTSIIMDLMIHDLDLLQALYGKPDWISLEQGRAVYSDTLDIAVGELGFGDMTAYVSASRDAEPERRWTMRFDAGTVDVDFAEKTLRHDTPFDLTADFGDLPEVRDSLAAAWDVFVTACLDGSPPLADGRAGLAAVRTAYELEGNP